MQVGMGGRGRWGYPRYRTQSRTKARGQAAGASRIMDALMTQVVCAPMKSPWREHTDCGMISATTTMSVVDTSSPISPVETEASRMDRKAARPRPNPHHLLLLLCNRSFT